MNLTEKSLKSPVAIAVGVGLIIVLGLVALIRLPVQLFPDIEEPVIGIFTGWRAAAPTEVESELIEPQEQALRGLAGLQEIQSFANAGGAFINLEFAIGTDMGRTLIDVIARMNQLPPLPRDADAPRISLGENGGGGPNETLSWFFVQLKPGTPGPVENYRREVEDLMRSRVESIPGVGTINVNAGAPDELRIEFDPYRAAELGIPIPSIVSVAGSADDVSGGFAELGRRQYTLRFAGRYQPADFGELVLDWRDGRPVRLADIATISVERGDRNSLAVQNNNPAIAIQILKESGADVLATLNAVKAEIGELREGPLAEMGLAIEQSFDPSVFINQALGLVGGNLVAGVILAIGVLWLFLRQFRSTLLVGIAIPVSVLATVLVMMVTGHSLNVISIAGIAFAVGMTLDAATIVLESILAARERGVPPAQAALEGATRVWPALLASTLTTIIVFLPVIFMNNVEGQLFADLALTISVAIAVSLVMAMTVLPVAAARWLQPSAATQKAAEWPRRLGERMAALTDSSRQRKITIALCLIAPAVLTWALLPPIDYLPPVKRDAIDGFFQFPPGMNVDAIEEEVVEPMVKRLAPYMAGEKEPRLKNYYILIFPGGGTIGARPLDPSKIDELGKVINEEITVGFPDLQVFAQQGNLFGGFGDGRNIEVRLQSADFDALLASARASQDIITEKMPGAQVRSFQDLELSEPELRLVPDDRRISESGWTRANVATVVRALGDGIWVGEHFDGDRRLDMILRASGWDSPDALAAVPVATPTGGVVPLGELVRIEPTVSSTGLRRVDGRRTIGINVVAPPGTSLQQAMQKLETDVDPAIRPVLPPDGGIRYAGDAGSLETALADMRVNIGLALLVLFLVMAALFRSARDSALVMLTVPLASLGGVLGIRFLNLFTPQTLDMLTMVGFIILLGAAVNNAILLVESARSAERAGMDRRSAVRHALEQRTRPIFATSIGQLAGLLPMIIVPGPGAALYRGLATVIAGGMLVNTVFMLVLLPALLRLGETASEAEAAPQPINRRRFPMTRSIAWCVAAAALAVSSLAASAAWAQEQEQPPAPVTVAPVTKGSLASTVTATGTVVSRNDARLAAEVTGRLDWVAEPGAKVAKGAPLARVDARALELQLAENDAQISRLMANAELLGTQLARLNALPEGIASKSQIDEAAARLSMAKHELAQARAARDSIRHQVSRAVIRAPFPGFVAERIRQLGEFVAAGAEVIRLTDTENVEVVARAPVAEAGHLAAGQPVMVRGTAKEQESKIRAIVPVGDERSRMIEVRVAMSGAGWPIGSAVRVDLPAARQTAGLMVPRDAVIVRSDGAHVFRVGKGEVAERIAVRVGNGDSQRVEVTGTLKAGDRVVVRGGERLRQGQAVKVAAGTGAKAAAAPAAPRG